jgi:2-haloacid dehalogenase
MTASVVVFDLGGVLINWQPHLAWMDELGSRAAVDAFMERVSFKARNQRGDGGARFVDLAAEIAEAEDRRRLAEYTALYDATIRDAVPGTWDVVERLHARGVPMHAITNWSAETWPGALRAYPRLAEVFGTIVVSGQEHMLKPDPRIYRLLCDRAGVAPADCVFIDDGMHNVDGARAVGMDAIHFTGAAALEGALRERGLL